MLPDSLSGLGRLAYICREDSGNRFWVGGTEGNACGVISADRGVRVARVPVLDGSRYGNAILYNPLTNRIYMSSAAQASVAVIDAATGEQRALLAVGRDPRGLALSTARNKVYVTNYADERVTVLDGQADTVITTLWVGRGPRYPCYNVFTDRIYTSNYSGRTVAVIDCRTDHLLTTVAIDADLGPLIYSPSANKVYVGHAWDSTVTVIEAAGNTVCAHIPAGRNRGQWPQGFCLAPDGDKIYCRMRYEEIGVIDAEGDSLRGRISVSGGAGAFAAHAGLNRLYCVTPDSNRVAVIDCATDSVLTTFPTGIPATRIVFDTSGRVGALVCPETDEVLLFDPDSNRVHTRLQYGWSVPGALCTDSTGDRLWCADERRGNVIRIDPMGNIPCCSIPVGDQPTALLHVAAHEKLYCANAGSGTVSVIDAARDSVFATLAVGGLPHALVWSPVSGLVYCSDYHSNSDSVAVIDAAGDSVLERIAVGARPAALVWSPVGNKVYVANYGGASVSVVDCATNRRIRNLPAGTGAYALVRVAATGRVFCANSYSNTVTVYDENADTLVAVVPVPAAPRAMAVDPTRNRVFCACLHGNCVVVLNGATGAIEATVATPRSPWALSYCPANDRVYCAHVDQERVSFIDAAQLTYDGDLDVGEWPQALAWSAATGRTYVSCGRESGLWVIADLPVGCAESVTTQVRLRTTRIVSTGRLEVEGSRAELVDAGGRRVLRLKSGRNDLSGVVPGIYFLVRSDAGTVERLLVVR